MVWDHYTEPVPVGDMKKFGNTSVYIRRTEVGVSEAGTTEPGQVEEVST